MIVKSSFECAWWLKNKHLKTLYPLTIQSTEYINQVEYESIHLKDGDFIELLWSNQKLSHQPPLVLLLHGLGGNIHSHYVEKIVKQLNEHGMRVVLMHFRGAGQNPNRMRQGYHAAETNDLNTVIHYLNTKEPHSPKMAIGVLLGGGVLLKWLCENGEQPWIKKALAISVPFDLAIAAKCISKGFSKFYQNHMLVSLKKSIIQKIQTFALEYPFTIDELMSFNDFFTFDERVTAPIFGFKNAMHYYQVGSCRQYLSGIYTPTLILHAVDDPFMDISVIPKSHELSPSVTLEITNCGGHVGFVEYTHDCFINWWPGKKLIKYFSEY